MVDADEIKRLVKAYKKRPPNEFCRVTDCRLTADESGLCWVHRGGCQLCANV